MTHVIGGPVWAASERRRAIGSYVLFLGACLLGGSATGWVLAAALPAYRLAWPVFAGLAIFLLSRDLFRLRIPLPQVRLQVPEALKARRRIGPVVYGLILGAGLLTYLPSAIAYVYLLALLLLVSPVQGIIVGASFGAAYALAVLVQARRTACIPPVRQAARVKELYANTRVALLLASAAVVAALIATSAIGT